MYSFSDAKNNLVVVVCRKKFDVRTPILPSDGLLSMKHETIVQNVKFKKKIEFLFFFLRVDEEC